MAWNTQNTTAKNGTSKNGTSKNGTTTENSTAAKKGSTEKGAAAKKGSTENGAAVTEIVKVTFVLPADTAPGKVSVLGDFNEWNPLAHPLKRRSNGTRSVSVELPAGTTAAFKYLDESGRWFCDPDHPEATVNEYGETNSLLTT